jgi:hypothetical protein
VADATQADVLQACANVLHFNIAAEADSIITPENGNCTYQKGSINHGPDPALLVGLDDCPDRSEAIVRFPISAQLGTAFSSGQVLDVALVLSADPAYKTNFVAGSVNVFAMTSAWDEGTGAYDGAQWYFAKAACTCAPSPSCCNYESKWELPGAAGPADRQGQAAGTMNIPSAPDVVSIDLEPAQLAPRVGAKLSVLLQTPDVLKLFFRSVQGKSAPSLLGNYCADP